MKDQKVTITDTRITYENNPNQVVMDAVSEDLMKAYSSVVCQNGGKILDIGFGLGYSAKAIYERVNNYTCIEINPQIYKKAFLDNKEKLNFNLILGDWIDIIPKLAAEGYSYDGIFMDTYGEGPETYTKFEEYAKMVANPGCILSIYSYHGIRDPKDLNSHYFEINNEHRLKYPRTFEKGHTVNWTYLIDNEWKKKIKTSAI